MGFIKDFKAFAMKGNVIDMAVGVIIGGAFGKIVTSLVNDIIMPLIGTVMGGIDFKEAKYVLKEATMVGDKLQPEVVMMYGNFIQNIVDFLIIALSIFVTIRVITKLTEKRKKEEEAAATAPAPAPQPSNEEKLLSEIRDLLKEKK